METIPPCYKEANRWHKQAIKALLRVTALHSFLAKHFYKRLISILAAHPTSAPTGSHSIVCNAKMEKWLRARGGVEGNHGSLSPFPYLLFFLINLCPPPVFLLYERRANTWLDLRAAELGRFNILILFYCPAAQSQTRWLYWHVLLRWHGDEQAGTKGKRVLEGKKRNGIDWRNDRKGDKGEINVCMCVWNCLSHLQSNN